MSAMRKTPAAVLWDMDGTLIDSEPIWLEKEREMLSRYNVELTPDIRDQIVGSGLRNAAEIFQRLGVPMEADEIIAEWATGVIAGIKSTTPDWRPGAVELLASLKAAGIPCALVTMSFRSIANAVIELLPPGTFTAVIAGDEVEYEKPHPDPYLRGAAALGVPIDACVAFEDSTPGLTSAHASGAVAIGIPHFTSLDAPSHAIWSTLVGVDAERLATEFRLLRALPESTEPIVTEAGAAQ